MLTFISKKKWFILKILLTGIIFWLLSHNSLLNLPLFYSVFSKPLYAILVIALFYAAALINTWRWYKLNEAQNINLTFPKTIMPNYLGIAFNTVLPGSVGGDVARMFYIGKKFPHLKSAAFLSVIFDRAMGLMGIIVLITCIAISRWQTFSHSVPLYSLQIACIGICVACIIVFFTSNIILKQFKTHFSHITWMQSIISLLEALHVYKNSKLVILQCLLASIGCQFFLLISILLINSMLGLPLLSPLDYMLALAIAQIANLIPFTPGGLGIGEAAFANVLVLLHPGMTVAYATAFFTFRFLMCLAYLPGIVLGIFGFNLLGKEGLVASTRRS